MAAIGIALGMLAILLASIVSQGYTAFAQHDLALEIYFDPADIDPAGHPRAGRPVAAPITRHWPAQSLQAVSRRSKADRAASAELALLSDGAGFELRQMVIDDPSLIGTSADRAARSWPATMTSC